MRGLTLDTGALLRLEGAKRTRASLLIASRKAKDLTVTVPAIVIGEWWRGQRGIRSDLLDAFIVEPLTEQLARLAGEALAKVPTSLPKGKGPSLVDAAVMASAAQRGDIVLTSDFDDLDMLRELEFPTVKLLQV